MTKILNTLTLPVLFLIPWFLMKIYNWENLLRNFIYTQPVLIILILLPSIAITLRWISRLFFKQGSY